MAITPEAGKEQVETLQKAWSAGFRAGGLAMRFGFTALDIVKEVGAVAVGAFPLPAQPH